jgi:hypothetical protein
MEDKSTTQNDRPYCSRLLTLTPRSLHKWGV